MMTNMWKNKERKTYAFTGDGKRYQSGWTSHTARYNTVSPEIVQSNTTYKFAPHSFDHGQPGAYNASHVEAQSLCCVEEGIPILVSRPMCDSCKQFVQHLAEEKGLTFHVGTPDGVLTFSNEGSIEEDSAEGETSTGITWSMGHEGRHSNLKLWHRSGSETEFTVGQSDDSEEGPIAMRQHLCTDGIIERSTYYQNKGTALDTLNVGGDGHDFETRIGPSNGVQDSYKGGKFERVPRNLVG